MVDSLIQAAGKPKVLPSSTTVRRNNVGANEAHLLTKNKIGSSATSPNWGGWIETLPVDGLCIDLETGS